MQALVVFLLAAYFAVPMGKRDVAFNSVELNDTYVPDEWDEGAEKLVTGTVKALSPGIEKFRLQAPDGGTEKPSSALQVKKHSKGIREAPRATDPLEAEQQIPWRQRAGRVASKIRGQIARFAEHIVPWKIFQRRNNVVDDGETTLKANVPLAFRQEDSKCKRMLGSKLDKVQTQPSLAGGFDIVEVLKFNHVRCISKLQDQSYVKVKFLENFVLKALSALSETQEEELAEETIIQQKIIMNHIGFAVLSRQVSDLLFALFQKYPNYFSGATKECTGEIAQRDPLLYGPGVKAWIEVYNMWVNTKNGLRIRGMGTEEEFKWANVVKGMNSMDERKRKAEADAQVSKWASQRPTVDYVNSEKVEETAEAIKEILSYLSTKYGPEPRATTISDEEDDNGDEEDRNSEEAGRARIQRLKERLVKFYQRYNPEKIPHIDYFITFQELDKDPAREKYLWDALHKKYGPEPFDIVAVLPKLRKFRSIKLNTLEILVRQALHALSETEGLGDKTIIEQKMMIKKVGFAMSAIRKYPKYFSVMPSQFHENTQETWLNAAGMAAWIEVYNMWVNKVKELPADMDETQRNSRADCLANSIVYNWVPRDPDFQSQRTKEHTERIKKILASLSHSERVAVLAKIPRDNLIIHEIVHQIGRL